MPAGVLIQNRSAGGPASNSSTVVSGSSDNARATGQPAEPAPTMM